MLPLLRDSLGKRIPLGIGVQTDDYPGTNTVHLGFGIGSGMDFHGIDAGEYLGL